MLCCLYTLNMALRQASWLCGALRDSSRAPAPARMLACACPLLPARSPCRSRRTPYLWLVAKKVNFGSLWSAALHAELWSAACFALCLFNFCVYFSFPCFLSQHFWCRCFASIVIAVTIPFVPRRVFVRIVFVFTRGAAICSSLLFLSTFLSLPVVRWI